MGIFFWVHSVALVEDLSLAESYKDVGSMRTAMEGAYQQVRYFPRILMSVNTAISKSKPLIYQYTVPHVINFYIITFQNAMNCWIAALLYLVTLCISAQQFWMNNRSSYSV